MVFGRESRVEGFRCVRLIHVWSPCFVVHLQGLVAYQTPTNSNTANTIRMARDSPIDRAFTEAFNELNKHCEDDELDTCVEKARELLQDNTLPNYHCIRTLVLLGSAVEYVCSSPFLDKYLPLHRDWREGRR